MFDEIQQYTKFSYHARFPRNQIGWINLYPLQKLHRLFIRTKQLSGRIQVCRNRHMTL